MAEQPAPDDRFPAEDGGASVDDQLPPVEPPSAGFIVQLFLVPALIVLAIVGVWALFGKVVSSDQDWQSLVSELRSTNEQRRWRAALSLAQMLRADQQPGTESGRLARNPKIAEELSSLLRKELQSSSRAEEDLKHQVFLTRTLGFLDSPETVLPVLREALQSDQAREVRKNALVAVAQIADRARGRARQLDRPELIHDVIRVSTDGDPLLRQVGAYTLGLIPGEPSRQRLEVLTDDPDGKTRINAAIGLARQDSTAGLPVLRTVLAEAAETEDLPLLADGAGEEKRRQARESRFEEFLVVKNAVKAVGVLQEELTPAQRREFRDLLQPISEDYPEARIRLEARDTLQKLQASGG